MEEDGVLMVHLLSSIEKFTHYCGLLYIPPSPDMHKLLFEVQYYDGTAGLVQWPSVIYAEPISDSEIVKIRSKLNTAKKLIGKGEWDYLWNKYGISQHTTMQVAICARA